MTSKNVFAKFTRGVLLSRSELKKVTEGVGAPAGDCLKKVHASFSDCMQCLIFEKCGSDWLCILACGTSAPICGFIASHMCLVKESNDLKP